MGDGASFSVLLLGLEPQAVDLVRPVCEGAEFTEVNTADEFEGQFENWQDGDFSVILCGPALQGMSSLEAAQVLLNQCPNTIKYYVTVTTENYEPRNLVKNGFNMSFALPVDGSLFKKSILENIASNRNQKSFRSVKVFDLEPGDHLDFETYVYLPLNRKYVRYTRANHEIEAKKLEKLQAKQMSQVFVDHRDMGKFYQYSARRLRELGDEGVSSTEKQEKLQDSVRSLFNDIFDFTVKADFDNGREMIKQCESIVSNYITKGASSSWYQKLLSSIGEAGDTYSHASNVATFAALFAIGIGYARPEDLAMAGLFHDLGVATLPLELQHKDVEEMTDQEKALYFTHPEKSVNMVKNKRIIVTPDVERAILQHHEKWSGKGWPKKLSASRIDEASQILSFADQFDYLTRYDEGKKRFAPLEALEAIRKSGSINPDLITRIRRVLDNERRSVKSA